MKCFWEDFLRGIPFGAGIILTLIGITLSIECGSGHCDEEEFVLAILSGTIGISLVLAGATNLIKKYRKAGIEKI